MLGALAGLTAVPLLGSASPRASRADGMPHRLLIFFSPNGTVPAAWFPPPGGAPTASELLEPLAPFSDRIVGFDRLDAESSYHGPGDGSHWNGVGHMLTATELVELGPASFYAGGVSVDQAIAETVATETRIPSLELGVEAAPATIAARMSYLGPAQPLPVEVDAAAAFDRVFGTVSTARRARRASVLDAALPQVSRLSQRLSGEDRHKLEQHQASLRALEEALSAGGRRCDSRALADAVATEEVSAAVDLQARGRLMIDLAVHAFTCDATRVASIMWAPSGATTVMSWLGLSEAHHTLSHEVAPQSIDKLRLIGRFYAQEFARLLSRLDEVPEGDGTLLDHTLVLWCNELGEGASHTRRRLPWLIAGGSALGVQGGRVIGSSVHHGEVLGAIARAFGLDIGCFGNPAYASGAVTL